MSLDYETITRVITYIDENLDTQPSLDELASGVGVSPSHLQRSFKRWAGISPKRFLQVATTTAAKELLRGHESVLDTTYRVGMSGPGRLHDLFVAVEAVTPGEYKSHGAGLTIRHGWHDTPFGPGLVAVSDRGIVALYFAAEGAADVDRLHADWSRAILVEDPDSTRPVMERVFSRVPGSAIPVLLKGTNLQVKVWEALLRIPEGHAVTYTDVARAVNRPDAVRAVASAIGRNPISYLVPCHRVLRSTGALGGYHWGVDRKRVMLAYEAAVSGR